jgi:hypothetical protein
MSGSLSDPMEEQFARNLNRLRTERVRDKAELAAWSSREKAQELAQGLSAVDDALAKLGGLAGPARKR